MKTNILLIFSLAVFLFSGCSTGKKSTEDTFHHYEIPPNTIKVSSNLFCDRTEISNFNWLEYMAWTKKIFGTNSSEYTALFPDTLSWLKANNCLALYAESYLRHSEYIDYPVVGISQRQAESYSKWRTDRVFEFMLVKYKIISFDTTQTKERHFTTQKFFNGQLQNIISDKKVIYYPEYRLPTLVERNLVMAYSDSINRNVINRAKSKSDVACKDYMLFIQQNMNPCISDSLIMDPTRIVFGTCNSNYANLIHNLRGNVAEWITEPHTTVGGGWMNKKPHTLTDEKTIVTESNAETGFRNICEWKKWKQ